MKIMSRRLRHLHRAPFGAHDWEDEHTSSLISAVFWTHSPNRVCVLLETALRSLLLSTHRVRKFHMSTTATKPRTKSPAKRRYPNGHYPISDTLTNAVNKFGTNFSGATIVGNGPRRVIWATATDWFKFLSSHADELASLIGTNMAQAPAYYSNRARFHIALSAAFRYKTMLRKKDHLRTKGVLYGLSYPV